VSQAANAYAIARGMDVEDSVCQIDEFSGSSRLFIGINLQASISFGASSVRILGDWDAQSRQGVRSRDEGIWQL
jgi:hypothetical protein